MHRGDALHPQQGRCGVSTPGCPCPSLPTGPAQPPTLSLPQPSPSQPIPGSCRPSRRVSAQEAGSGRRSGAYAAHPASFPPRFVTLEFPFRRLGGGNGGAAPPLSASRAVAAAGCPCKPGPARRSPRTRSGCHLWARPGGDTQGPGWHGAGSAPEEQGGDGMCCAVMQ